MAENKSSKALKCYVEFEPFCKWQHKDEVDILEIHLPEFKKEQLKVQISSNARRVLKIYGERPIDSSSSSSRKLKFYKEIPLSATYEASAANAKLVKGWLYITIPKLKNTSSALLDHQEHSSREAPKQVAEPSHLRDAHDDAMCELHGHDRESSICLRLAKMAATMVVVAASLGGLIAFVDYGYKAISVGVEECMVDCMDLMRVI